MLFTLDGSVQQEDDKIKYTQAPHLPATLAYPACPLHPCHHWNQTSAAPRNHTLPILHSAATLKWLVCVSQTSDSFMMSPFYSLSCTAHLSTYCTESEIGQLQLERWAVKRNKTLIKWDSDGVKGSGAILCINADQGRWFLNALQFSQFWVVNKSPDCSLLGAEHLFYCSQRQDSLVSLCLRPDCGTAELSRKTSHPYQS